MEAVDTQHGGTLSNTRLGLDAIKIVIAWVAGNAYRRRNLHYAGRIFFL